ncbi:MAG: SIS domain-containing protein [Patescibacteria group bacterium]|jgi:glucose/mannose-6-phosphate isomerase
MDKNEQEMSVEIALSSVVGLGDQCLQSWQEARKTVFSSEYQNIRNIVVCGMGGSSTPAFVVNSVFKPAVPLYVCQGYTLPAWVDEHTLVVLSSYSGNTEETLSCAGEAKEKGCFLTGLCSGGKLADLFNELNIPHYQYDPKHNPSKMPRLGIGYGMFGLLGLLSSLNLIKGMSGDDLDSQLGSALKYVRANSDKIETSAQEFVDKFNSDAFMIFSAEHMKGNGIVFATQLNETSKRLAFASEVPELNHNLVVGLTKLQGSITPILFRSENYHPRVLYRFEITKEILDKAGYKSYVHKISNGSLLQEMLETLVFSSYCSVLFAKKNDIDPLMIPTIDFIKGKLLTK